MSKFAIYTYLFSPFKSLEIDFDNPESDIYDKWNRKQEIFGSLFNADLKFEIGNNLYVHVLIPFPQNKDIIILRIGKEKGKNLEEFTSEESKFIAFKHQYYPNCYVFIDNRKDVQRIAIQKKTEAFANTRIVAKIIEKVISELLERYQLSLEINPKMHCSEFKHIIKTHKNRIGYIKFNWKHPNLPAISDLLGDVLKVGEETHSDPSLELNHLPTGEPIYISENSDRIMKFAEASAATGKPINIKTLDGIDIDCFVVDENYEKEDQQVFESLPTEVLKNLDDDDLKVSSYAHIIEFLNNLKLVYA